MREYTLRASMQLPVPRAEVFAFFADATNLGRITPPQVGFRLRTPGRIEMRPGTLIDYTIRFHGIPIRWRTEITRWEPPHEFADVQLRGPYARWVHVHRFREEGRDTVIEDDIRYVLPFGALGRLAHPLVRRQLARIFEYRQEAIARIFLGERGRTAALPPSRPHGAGAAAARTHSERQ